MTLDPERQSSDAAPPYATPLEYAVPNAGIACPRCGHFGAKPVSFTWWGGVIGPKMLHHTKCDNCRYKFNAKTGKSNMTAIVIYQIVGLGIATAAFIALRAI